MNRFTLLQKLNCGLSGLANERKSVSPGRKHVDRQELLCVSLMFCQSVSAAAAAGL